MSTERDPGLAQDFVEFAVACGALSFGEFRTKAGRLSPYFFNAGHFSDGDSLRRLAAFYARRLLGGTGGGTSAPDFDLIFGPAYKGITLAAALAVELAHQGHKLPFAYNRKEAKDHGEGGLLVGAPMRGRVLIVDDVISAGTSVRESVALITAAGARPTAVAIMLDRQERATEGGKDMPWSATQYVQREYGLRVESIATLADLLAFLRASGDPRLAAHAGPVAAYRERYGV